MYEVFASPQLGREWQQPTSEEVDYIERFYDIRLYFGTHGLHDINLFQASLEELSCRPTNKEYDQAALAARLRPGDMLFVEEYGSGGLQVGALPHATAAPAEATALNDIRNQALIKAQLGRASCTMSAWGYASLIAHANGAGIVGADLDAETANALFVKYQKNLLSLMNSSYEEDRRLAAQIHHMRVESAYRIVVDYARAPMQGRDSNSNEVEKSRLHLLWGSAHESQISAMFEAAGITTSKIMLKESSRVARTAEHMANIVQMIIAECIVGNNQSSPQKTLILPRKFSR